MTPEEVKKLKDVSARLGVSPQNLFLLIQHESRWNPRAMNPKSSAKGLIQFVDKTARNMGYSSSYDLISRHPTILQQLDDVEYYLRTFAPFPTLQSLCMAVFYPAARAWVPTRQFPDSVRAVNPGINSPADYVSQVQSAGAASAIATIFPLIVIAGIIFLFIRH